MALSLPEPLRIGGDPRLLAIPAATALAGLLVVVVLYAPWAHAVAIALGLVAGAALLTRPYFAVLAFLALRLVLDLLWWAEGTVGGLNLLQLASAAVIAATVGLLVLRLKDVLRHPMLPWLCVLSCLVALGALRADSLTEAMKLSAELTTPWLLLALVTVLADSPKKRVGVLVGTAIAGVIPVLSSLRHVALGTGTFHLHGYDRLLGDYANLHNHALVMAVLTAVAITAIALSRTHWQRALGAALLLGAGACLVLTYVRTALLAVAAFLVIFLVLEKRWRWVAGLGVAFVLLVLFSGTVQDRFSDLVEVFTMAETESRDDLGSGRWMLWKEGITHYRRGGPADWFLGRGLGAHWAATSQHIDPHSDLLSVLLQIGPIGLLTWIGGALLGAWRAFRVVREAEARSDRTLAAFVLGLLVVMGISVAISNAFITRPSLGWVAWALVGVCFAVPLTSHSRGRTP